MPHMACSSHWLASRTLFLLLQYHDPPHQDSATEPLSDACASLLEIPSHQDFKPNNCFFFFLYNIEYFGIAMPKGLREFCGWILTDFNGTRGTEDGELGTPFSWPWVEMSI